MRTRGSGKDPPPRVRTLRRADVSKEQDMNLKQIEYLVAVVRNGSFSLAAKECYVTVQAVSKAIADLEREVGESLFVRESRGVSPTPFGIAFCDKAREVLRAFEELEALPQTYAVGEGSRPALRLALYAPRFNNNEFVCASIERFIGKNLGIKVETPLLNGTEATEQLRAHLIDAFVSIGTFSQPDMDCVPIGSMSTAIVMGIDHPLTAKDKVTLEDINQYPVLHAPEFDSFNDSVLNTYRKHGLTSEIFMPESAESYEHFVKELNGLSFAVSMPAVPIVFPGTISRPIDPKDVIPIPICLVSPKEGKTKAYYAAERLLKGNKKAL